MEETYGFDVTVFHSTSMGRFYNAGDALLLISEEVPRFPQRLEQALTKIFSALNGLTVVQLGVKARDAAAAFYEFLKDCRPSKSQFILLSGYLFLFFSLLCYA